MREICHASRILKPKSHTLWGHANHREDFDHALKEEEISSSKRIAIKRSRVGCFAVNLRNFACIHSEGIGEKKNFDGKVQSGV